MPPPDFDPRSLLGEPVPEAPKDPVTATELRRMKDLLSELARRKVEALHLYDPLPTQALFHKGEAAVRLLRGSNRAGKAQPVDEPVLTPFGWVPIGSIRVGDLVIGGDGRPARVTGVFPQGIRQTFHVRFSDGATTRCCDEHLWKVAIRNDRFGDGVKWRVLSLAEIRRRCGDEMRPWSKPLIPTVGVELPARSLPLDPYLMGLLVGDGCFANCSVGFSTGDQEIVEAVARLLPATATIHKRSGYDYYIRGSGSRNPVRAVLRWYGLAGKKSYQKTIPDDYLFNSAANRMALLQGLLDTDGSVTKKIAAEFSTTSAALADQVAFLARSLGGTCTVAWRTTCYTYKGVRREGRRSARCRIRFPAGVCPFRLTRKVSAFSESRRPFVGRLMERVEAAGESECVCIEVDTPDHTYVTRDCVVTHNTLSSFVELARAVTNRDPFKKYPAENGRAYVVGKDQKHIGEVVHRKLFRAGAFKIIRDEKTGAWRAFKPWADGARRREAKPAPPLIPPRFVKSMSWALKKENVVSKVVLTTGWEVDFFSSLGKPPQGSDLDLVVFDEEIVDGEWFPEMQARLLDRQGRFWWGATPQLGTDRLWELHLRCEREAEEYRLGVAPQPSAREYVLLLADNPHIDEDAKRQLAASLDDQSAAVRIGAEFAVQSSRVFPEWAKKLHVVDWFPVPDDWTRFAAVDPGRQICAALFLAVPPPPAVGVYLYDELYIANADAAEFGRVMQTKADAQRFETFLIDHQAGRQHEIASGKTVEEQYAHALKVRAVESRRSGNGFEWGNPDVAGGVEICRSYLRGSPDSPPRLRVLTDRCPNFIWEIERYRYKRVNQVTTDIPEDRGRVHLMACLRYLLASDPQWVEPGRKRPKPQGAYAAYLARRKADRKNRPGGVILGPDRRPR